MSQSQQGYVLSATGRLIGEIPMLAVLKLEKEKVFQQKAYLKLFFSRDTPSDLVSAALIGLSECWAISSFLNPDRLEEAKEKVLNAQPNLDLDEQIDSLLLGDPEIKQAIDDSVLNEIVDKEDFEMTVRLLLDDDYYKNALDRLKAKMPQLTFSEDLVNKLLYGEWGAEVEDVITEAANADFLTTRTSRRRLRR